MNCKAQLDCDWLSFAGRMIQDEDAFQFTDDLPKDGPRSGRSGHRLRDEGLSGYRQAVGAAKAAVKHSDIGSPPVKH